MNWYSVTSYCLTEEADYQHEHIVPALTRINAICQHMSRIVKLGLSENLNTIYIHSTPEFAGIEEKFCRAIDGELVEV